VFAQIEQCLARNCSSDSLHGLLQQLEDIERLLQRHNRRRTLVWSTSVALAAVGTSLLLHTVKLGRAPVSLVATTDAFVVENADVSANALVDAAALRDLSLSAGGNEVCLTTDAEASNCAQTAVLKLNTVVVNARSTIMIRKERRCFEVHVFDGGAAVTTTSLPAKVSAQAATWETRHAALRAGDSIRICPLDEVTIGLTDISGVVVAYRTFGGVAEREESPALLKGTVSITNVDKSIELKRTDIPRIGSAHGRFVARLQDSIDLSVVADAEQVDISNGLSVQSRSLIPSYLDRVMSSPFLKLVLGLIATITGTLIAIRERFLAK